MNSRPFALALAAGAALAFFSSCGGSKTSSTPTAVATPTPAPATVHTDLGGTNFNVRVGRSSFANVDFPPAGTLDVTASWPGDSNIDIYATDASCPGFESVSSGACAILAKGVGLSTKPERITFPTQTGKIYTIHTTGDYGLYGNGWWRLSRVDDGPTLVHVALARQDQHNEKCHHRSSATVHVDAKGQLEFLCSERNIIHFNPSGKFGFKEGHR